MKMLIYSTNGIGKDGITSWMLQNMSRLRRGLFGQVDTVAFPGVDESLVVEFENAGVNVHRLPHRKQHPLAYMRSLRRLIRTGKYDVVHINGNSGTVVMDLICCIGKTPKSRIVHSRNTVGQLKTVHRVLRPMMNALCTERLACGQAAGEWMFGKRPFTVMPNGRDFEAYSYVAEVRSQVRSELGVPSDYALVGHVGNFTRQKNHGFLISAFSEALKIDSRLQLVLIGDGFLRAEVEEKVRYLGLQEHVVFTGRSSKVNKYLSAFDVAVLPSLYEGFPNVAIEWQINGLPSLLSTTVTDEVAVTDLVHFVQANDPVAWGRAIVSTERVDRRIKSSKAQGHLKRAGYAADDGAARLLDFYTSIPQLKASFGMPYGSSAAISKIKDEDVSGSSQTGV